MVVCYYRITRIGLRFSHNTCVILHHDVKHGIFTLK